jgi:hypothetical protein
MRWRLFFLVLIILGSVAVTVPIVYNLSLQLKPEQIEAARQRWQANGPRDYDLDISSRLNDQEKADEFHVCVRDGKVTKAWCNNQKLNDAEKDRHTVERMLDYISATLRRDAESGGKRNYAMADFDSRDGHPRRYVHRVATTKEREEWIIKLVAPPEKE